MYKYDLNFIFIYVFRILAMVNPDKGSKATLKKGERKTAASVNPRVNTLVKKMCHESRFVEKLLYVLELP